MRAIPITAVLLSLAFLQSPAQTPRALHGVTPDTKEIPERLLHPNALSEPDITVPSTAAPSSRPVFVAVSYLVSAAGEVQDAVSISGPAAYRQLAAGGVMHFKYQPYMVDNEPRPVKSLVMIEFQGGVGKRIEPPPPPPLAGVPGGNADNSGPVAPTPTGPVRISTGVAAGMLIHKVDPVYPADARAANVQGTVVLHAIIAETGTVEKLDVISGPAALAAAAIDAVSQWRYRPYLLNGDPVKVETTININFTLTGPPATENQQPQ